MNCPRRGSLDDDCGHRSKRRAHPLVDEPWPVPGRRYVARAGAANANIDGIHGVLRVQRIHHTLEKFIYANKVAVKLPIKRQFADYRHPIPDEGAMNEA